MRVPICTPSAPSANAAAMVRPSTMPPAAITGTFTFSQTSGSRTMLDDFARVLEAAALAAFDHQAVDARIDRAQRRLQRRHDMKHGEARFLQRPHDLLRIAGRGGDELHALIEHEFHDVRDRARRRARR